MILNRIQQALERHGAYALGLPLYYCLHHYLQYYGLLSAETAATAALLLSALFIILYMILYRFTRHRQRAALMVAFLGTIFLFFGNFKDALAQLPWAWMSRYRFLLPAIFLILLFGVTRIRQQQHFRKTNLYLNLLLLLFLLLDGFSLLRHRSGFFWKRNILVQQNRIPPDSRIAASLKPDIYFLVFDSYPGANFLRQFHQYDNRELITDLEDRGFRFIKHSFSNYNRTAFSIASVLNAEYLKDIRPGKAPEAREYNRARLSIDKSVVPDFLQQQGYELHNLSVFPVNGTPPLYEEHFLTLPEMQVMLYPTLPARIRRDILWHFISGRWSTSFFQWLYRMGEESRISLELSKRNFNDRCIDSLMKIPARNIGPKFIYGHLYLPHPPYFYNEQGVPLNLEQVSRPEAIDSKPLFLGYLKYTNQLLLKLTDQILQGASRPSVIILQSDHGLRDFAEGPRFLQYGYENFCAYFFPDKDYTSLYDSLSNVNTFPVLLNKYFHTALPMLPDTVVQLPVYTEYPAIKTGNR